MKKVVSLVLSLAFLMSCLCLSGCNNQEREYLDPEGIRAADIEKALIDAGYNEAHKKYDTSEFNIVYLDNTETDRIGERNSRGDYIPLLAFYNSRDDIPKILDAVMPLYDKEYNQGDGYRIIDGLINKREMRNNGNTRGGSITFNDYKYEESLDDTSSFTKYIEIESYKN